MKNKDTSSNNNWPKKVLSLLQKELLTYKDINEFYILHKKMIEFDFHRQAKTKHFHISSSFTDNDFKDFSNDFYIEIQGRLDEFIENGKYKHNSTLFIKMIRDYLKYNGFIRIKKKTDIVSSSYTELDETPLSKNALEYNQVGTEDVFIFDKKFHNTIEEDLKKVVRVFIKTLKVKDSEVKKFLGLVFTRKTTLKNKVNTKDDKYDKYKDALNYYGNKLASDLFKYTKEIYPDSNAKLRDFRFFIGMTR